ISRVAVRGGGTSGVQKGVYWKIDDGSEAWYPQTGYRDGAGLNREGYVSYVLSKANSALRINTFTNGDITHSSPNYSTSGCSVRCVKE
ncbi:MAG: hypothetical protein II322_02055, partial [Alistipes sp.]|nr:hypothetical protein [Alistipes sp.]